MNKDKHVIVISVDAMITSDIAEFEKRPNMKAILAHSARVDEMHCIYPTYTYPCHTSIMTGCYPDKHGIYHNDIFDLNSSYVKWFWYAKDIKRPTMIDVAHEAGLTTGSVVFPVQGGAKADYLIAEIWTPKMDEDPAEIFKSVDSPAVEHIFEENKHMLNWLKTPEFDLFASKCACDIIKEFKPNLLFIHFSYLDHQRHRCGYETKNNIHAINFIDERIGEVRKAVLDAGISQETDFVILGDHGQINVDTVFHINKLLADQGYIDLDENGKVKDWRIFVHSTSFSGQVYTKGIDLSEAKKALMDLREKYPEYIERVMNKFEVKEIYHLDGPFDFVLEAQTHVIFGQGLTGDLCNKPEPGNYKFSLSTHGYAPEKGPNPPFIISGPDANVGNVIKQARLVDEASTIMSIFGLEMPEDVDGHVVEGLIK